jgi:proteasome accessory factor C
LEVSLRVGDPQWLVRLALRLAPQLEVVEPADLRAAVVERGRAALALYAEPTTTAEGDGVA